MPKNQPPSPQDETPWGPAESVQELSDGFYWVETAGHGGLFIGMPIRRRLPRKVATTFLNGAMWAEQDSEAPIALTILSRYLKAGAFETLAQDGQSAEERIQRERNLANLPVQQFERYQPCAPYL